MMDNIIQIIAAGCGSLGYTFLFRMKSRYRFPASVGGAAAWTIYLLMMNRTANLFLATLTASAFGAVYSEILARSIKTPATLFVLPTMVPLIPGGNLYYMMSYIVQGNKTMARIHGEKVLLYAAAIAGGISITTAIWDMVIHAKKQWTQPKNR